MRDSQTKPPARDQTHRRFQKIKDERIMHRKNARDKTRTAESDNVKKQHSEKPINQGLSHRLERTTFRTSREMDFFSEKELVTQTGHEISDWSLVFAKEVIDNSLDACDEADIAPVIEVTADASGITVKDNGPGLPENTLGAAMDFTIRASNREAYVAPDRGAQGNALKTILPMPVVVDPEHGRLIVQAHGKQHIITCGADPISQQAVIHDDTTVLSTVGTSVRIEWSPEECDGVPMWPFRGLEPTAASCWGPSFSDRFHAIVEGFAIFNPHATFRLNWFGQELKWEATDPVWQKWKPDKPTSAHWYELPHLERLIGAYITHDREAGEDRFVSDFIAEFDGLTGSQKRGKVLVDSDLKRVRLSELVADNRLDSDRIATLLQAMQAHTRPVKSQRLGVIGEDHLKTRLLEMGVQPESFRYSRKLSKDGLPCVLESAFGWLGDESADRRRIYAGANWSAAIKNPFRSFGSTGEGLEAALSEQRAGRSEPIVFVLHLAHPRVEYTDRGKSALVIGGAA
jgi:DNA topoisomerase VI subunit B